MFAPDVIVGAGRDVVLEVRVNVGNDIPRFEAASVILRLERRPFAGGADICNGQERHRHHFQTSWR